MIRNEAPESMNGEYKVLVNGKKVTVTNMKTQEVATARCHPDDEFDLGVGVNEAIKKMNEIKVGDLVKIVNNGKAYTTYADWVYQNVDGADKCRYAYGDQPRIGNAKYRVVAVAKHGSFNDMLVYVRVWDENDSPWNSCYLVGLKGLEKVVD